MGMRWAKKRRDRRLRTSGRSREDAAKAAAAEAAAARRRAKLDAKNAERARKRAGLE